jgi:hypothetical protein
MAAPALAVLQMVINEIGIGWCFTILGVLGGLCGPVMVWEMRCGRVYRRNRANGAVA